MFAITHGEASDTDADLGGIFAAVRNTRGFRWGNDTRLAAWFNPQARGHANTQKVSSFQKARRHILYLGLFSSAVRYFLGNFITKIAVAVTKMHRKLFSACYLDIRVPSACGLR